MNPNWPGSLIGSRTGFNAMSMMKLSATFERVGVREIGLKSSLMLQIEDALGRGQTLASFNASGTLHSKNEVMKYLGCQQLGPLEYTQNFYVPS